MNILETLVQAKEIMFKEEISKASKRYKGAQERLLNAIGMLEENFDLDEDYDDALAEYQQREAIG